MQADVTQNFWGFFPLYLIRILFFFNLNGCMRAKPNNYEKFCVAEIATLRRHAGMQATYDRLRSQLELSYN